MFDRAPALLLLLVVIDAMIATVMVLAFCLLTVFAFPSAASQQVSNAL